MARCSRALATLGLVRLLLKATSPSGIGRRVRRSGSFHRYDGGENLDERIQGSVQGEMGQRRGESSARLRWLDRKLTVTVER